MENISHILVQRHNKTVELPFDEKWTLEYMREYFAKCFQVLKEELGHLTINIEHQVHFFIDDSSLKRALSSKNQVKIIIRPSDDEFSKEFQYAKEMMAKKRAELPKLDIDIKIPEFSKENKTAIIEQAFELDQKLVDEIKSFISQDRVPSKSPINNFLIAYYKNEIQKYGIGFQKDDYSILALDIWRQSQRRKANLEDNTVFLPILTLPAHLSEKAPFSRDNSYLFSHVQPRHVETPQHQGGYYLAKEHTGFIQTFAEQVKFFFLDGIHYAMTLASRHQLTREKFNSIFNVRYFSDTDIKFASMIINSWVKQSLQGKVEYLPPSSDDHGVLADFGDNQNVGIVGDWGTNLQDAFDILDELVLNRGVTVILHTGDRYYEGCSYKFEQISNKLAQLRKIKPNLRYYTFPSKRQVVGRMQAQQLLLENYNDPYESAFTQKRPFYCIKNESSTVQFIGVNTQQQSLPQNKQDIYRWLGVLVENKQVAWAINKIKKFPGQTILISHHPLFSTFKKINGQWTEKGKKNQHVNHILAMQFFEVLPKITWIWGHQNRFSTFTEGAFGVHRSVLIGNSAKPIYKEDYQKEALLSGGVKGVTASEQDQNYINNLNEKSWINKTAIVLKDWLHPYKRISAEYVSMNAQYGRRSLLVETYPDSYSPAQRRPLLFKHPFKLLTDNGLSLAVSDCVWFDSTPTEIQFVDPGNPQSQEPVAFYQKVLIRVHETENYLYFDGKKVGFGPKSDNQALRFRLWNREGREGIITTQDVFALQASHENKMFGPVYQFESKKYLLQSSHDSLFLAYTLNKKESNPQILVERGQKKVKIPVENQWTLSQMRQVLAKKFSVTSEELGYLTITVDHEVHFILDDYCLNKAASSIKQGKIIIRSQSDDLTQDLIYVNKIMMQKNTQVCLPRLDIELPQFSEKDKVKFKEIKIELDQKIIDEIKSFTPERHAPSECVIDNFIISFYLEEAKKRGIDFEDIDKTIFALSLWRQSKQKNMDLKQNQFPVPVLTLPQFIAQKAPFSLDQSYLFSSQPLKSPSIKTLKHQNGDRLAKEHRKYIQQYPDYVKLFVLDRLHYAIMLIASQRSFKPDKVHLMLNIRHFSDSDYSFLTESIITIAENFFNKDLIYTPPNLAAEEDLPEFEDNETVGILGDWGTNFRDAYDILDELVKKRGATVILHNGDVYYFGKNSVYQLIRDKLNQLRQEGFRVRYYTVPGNHDYYTKGGSFHESLATNNQPGFCQTKSYFCIKNRSHTIQFIGVDTGRYDYQFNNVFDGLWQGVQVYPEEVAWAKNKINTFLGHTILISHHPLFSTFEPTIGRYTMIGQNNRNVTPKLAKQFFEVLPKITCWMWGHEHRFSTFDKGAFGVNRSVLIGNSAYSVDKKNYYKKEYPCGGITENDFHPYYGTSNTDKGWLNLTAIVLSDLNRPTQPIQANYVYMTSSYDKRSVLLETRTDTYDPVERMQLIFNDAIKLLTDNCLSIAVDKYRVYFDSTPTDFQFMDPNDDQSEGPVSFGQEVLIRVHRTEKYLYFDGRKEVIFGPMSENPAMRFRLRSLEGREGIVTTHDAFALWSSDGNYVFGAVYSKKWKQYHLRRTHASKFLAYNVKKRDRRLE